MFDLAAWAGEARPPSGTQQHPVYDDYAPASGPRPRSSSRAARSPRALPRGSKPEVVAFVGVTVYRAFFGPGIAPGAGPKPERIGKARVFVVPNPSGLNAAHPGFEDKLVWFRRPKRQSSAASRTERQSGRRRQSSLPIMVMTLIEGDVPDADDPAVGSRGGRSRLEALPRRRADRHRDAPVRASGSRRGPGA